MKNILRIVSLGAIAAGLFNLSAIAGSQSFSTSGYTNSNGVVDQAWTYSTPAATSISSTITLTSYVSGGGGGNANVNVNNYAGTQVFNLLVSTYLGSKTNSGSTSGLPAGTYWVHHGWGGTPGQVYGNFTTTLSW